MEHCHEFPVEVMCEVFGISRSGFYAWLKRPRSARSVEDKELGEHIEQIHHQMNGRYGTRRIHQELRRRGRRCSKKRIERLKRQRGLKARQPRRWVPRTTDSRHQFAVAGNLSYRTREEARQSIFEYIESVYNRVRLHSTLNYLSPVEFEQEYSSMNLCPL